ncbi:aspartyl-phosphate phosphatase Spo0E family protein [Aeribacillus pallidus]|uniref:aspartyl-phosphate phosphatase Spo0E family protein n=1 Tax=Aeribacillus pallidus TaxID=33936 RepID=UPI001D571588|nr:aspartyl-phosphate phosphatase Spo0E family protein [Bacillus sp. (in: firmicutes)]
MIYEKRKEMIELGIKYGFTNDLTIQCSQELDQLLNEYYFSSLKQRIKKKNSA